MSTLTHTERVIAACAEAWEVDIEQLLGRSRGTVSVSDARHAAMHILSTRHMRSGPEIEATLKRHRVSVHYGKTAASVRLQNDRVFRQRYNAALELIGGEL